MLSVVYCIRFVVCGTVLLPLLLFVVLLLYILFYELHVVGVCLWCHVVDVLLLVMLLFMFLFTTLLHEVSCLQFAVRGSSACNVDI